MTYELEKNFKYNMEIYLLFMFVDGNCDDVQSLTNKRKYFPMDIS
jgi:hypothetical protein